MGSLTNQRSRNGGGRTVGSEGALRSHEGTVIDRSTERALPDRLNLGCGTDYREGWLNVDLDPDGGLEVDQRIDLFAFPWDLPSSAFDLVLASHLVEHVPHRVPGETRDGFLRFMEEVHRVLRPDGRLVVKTPHWESPKAIMDPTHTRVIHLDTWWYFSEAASLSFYSDARFALVDWTVSEWTAYWGPRIGPSELPLGRHLSIRFPPLGRLLGRPDEITYVLERR